MTERQAWAHLAALWEKPSEFGYVMVGDIHTMGLCTGIRVLENKGHISWRVAYKMTNRVEQEGRRLGTLGYIWPHGDIARAEFCKTQANRRSKWSPLLRWLRSLLGS